MGVLSTPFILNLFTYFLLRFCFCFNCNFRGFRGWLLCLFFFLYLTILSVLWLSLCLNLYFLSLFFWLLGFFRLYRLSRSFRLFMFLLHLFSLFSLNNLRLLSLDNLDLFMFCLLNFRLFLLLFHFLVLLLHLFFNLNSLFRFFDIWLSSFLLDNLLRLLWLLSLLFFDIFSHIYQLCA